MFLNGQKLTQIGSFYSPWAHWFKSQNHGLEIKDCGEGQDVSQHISCGFLVEVRLSSCTVEELGILVLTAIGPGGTGA